MDDGLVFAKARSRYAEGVLHPRKSARRTGGRELRRVSAKHQDSAQGAQGRLAPVRPELLPPLSPGRAPCRGGRHFDKPCRLSMHHLKEERVMKKPVSLVIGAAQRGLLSGCALLALTAIGAHAQEATTVPPATVVGAEAQETTVAPGAPNATTTIDGRYLPPPPQKFQGEINLNAAQSKPAWPARVVPPKGAPSILLIMTDDVGFGAPSTFGGVIPTPALDRIAANGLRFTNFHSTALCSPTRAALITGRNHHSVGFGVVSEAASGYPGYDSVIGKDSTTIGRILLENGYRTSWFGKDHNTPTYQASQAGPFSQWPIGMGFEYFYGFVGGDTSQWEPNLFRNTTAIYPYVGHP